MHQIIKWWLLGIFVIMVLFLSFSPPSVWYLYLDNILNTPLSITIQQSGWLVLGGSVLGSAMMIIKDMLFG